MMDNGQVRAAGAAEEKGADARVVAAIAEAPIVLPNDDALLTAEFIRDGADLRLESPSGDTTIVQDYFALDAARDLVIAGAVVPGRMVGKLAREARVEEPVVDLRPSPTDSFDATAETVQLASLPDPVASPVFDAAPSAATAILPDGDPIAQVTDIDGPVFITRGDGAKVRASEGDPLFEDDVLSTATDGSVGVTFVDGMTFSLSKGGRMVLDEFAYSDETETGGGLLSVLQGKFSFVSGKAAHTHEDALMIETPTMTIGVRGTKVVSEISADGTVSRIALLAEEDGTVGKIMVMTDGGEQLISDPNRMVEVESRFDAPSPQREISSSEVFDFFGSALDALPAPTAQFEAQRVQENFAEVVAQQRQEQREQAAQEADARAAQAEDASAAGAEPAVEEGAADDAADAEETAEGEASEGEAREEDVAEEDVAEEAGEEVAAEGDAAEGEPVEEGEVVADEADADETVEGEELAASSEDAAADDDASSEATAENAASETEQTAASEPAVDPSPAEAETIVDASPSPSSPPTDPSVDAAPSGFDGVRVTNEAPDPAPIQARSQPEDRAAVQSAIAGEAESPAIPAFAPPVSPERAAEAIRQRLADAEADRAARLEAERLEQLRLEEEEAVTEAKEAAEAAEEAAKEDEESSEEAIDEALELAEEALEEDGAFEGLIVDVAPVEETPQASEEDETETRAAFERPAEERQEETETERTLLDEIADAAPRPLAEFAPAPNSAAVAASTVFSAPAQPFKAPPPPPAPPALDPTGVANFETAFEDAAPTALLVSDLLGASAGEDVGIALVAADQANGVWEVSLNGGETFQAIGAVTDASALLLDGGALLRFAPSTDFHGDAAIAFRAWDVSTIRIGSKMDISAETLNGATPFSSTVAKAVVAIEAVNDAPRLVADTTPEEPAVLSTAAKAGAFTVESLLAGVSAFDVDGESDLGVALTSLDDANGVWEVSFDGGETFEGVGEVARGTGLLLKADAQLRFLPNQKFDGDASLTFRAWDQTEGTANQTVDLDAIGGASAFSATAAMATVTIQHVNTAPVLTVLSSPSFNVGVEDQSGFTVFSPLVLLANTKVSDIDGAPIGVAVTGLDQSVGTWAYSLDDGVTFFEFGELSAESATLLDQTTLIGFRPVENYFGPVTVSARAWDLSSGSVGDQGVDTTSAGAQSAFSLVDRTMTWKVVAVNDAPVLTATGQIHLDPLSALGSAPEGVTISSLLANTTITDADGPAAQAIAIVGADTSSGYWEYSTDAGTTYAAMGVVSDVAALLLDATALVRFVPNLGFTGTASLDFRAWDQTVGAHGDTGVDVSSSTSVSAEVLSAKIESPFANLAVKITDGASQATVGEVTEGATFSADILASANFVVELPPHIEAEVGSVTFTLTNSLGQTFTKTESVLPWALFGDDSEGTIFSGPGFDAGDYTLDLEFYSGASGSSELLAQIDYDFTVTPDPNTSMTLFAPGVLDVTSNNARVTVANAPWLGDPALTTDEVTVEAWFFYDGTNANLDPQAILSYGARSSGDDGFRVMLEGDTLMVMTGIEVDSGVVEMSIAETNVADIGWNHVAFSIDGDGGIWDVDTYLNGDDSGWVVDQRDASDYLDPALNGASKGLIMGARQKGNGGGMDDQYEGYISDVRIWDHARKEVDIHADMGRFVEADAAGLVANWRLDTEAGPTTYDNVTGGARQGSREGGAAWASGEIAVGEITYGRVVADDAPSGTLSFTSTGGGVGDIDGESGAFWLLTSDTTDRSYQVSDGLGGLDTITVSAFTP